MRGIIFLGIMILLIAGFVIGDKICSIGDFFGNYSEAFKAGERITCYERDCILRDSERLLSYKYGSGNLWSQCVEVGNIETWKESIIANNSIKTENGSIKNKTEAANKTIENKTKIKDNLKVNKTSDNETMEELENRLKNFPKIKLPPNSGLVLLGLSPTILMFVFLMLLLKLGKKKKKKRR